MTSTRSLVEAEIHRKALENIINEMAITLVRTSGSPIVTDANDFSTCLLDVNGQQLGLATNMLCHSASSLFGTQAVLRDIAASGEHPEPGDAWLVNDPYEGGAMHQGDMGVISPIFRGDDIISWVFCNMHLLDVGGSGVSGIAPGARTVYEEGLRFAPIKAIRGGKIEHTWEKYISSNVRVPAPVLNDIRSMIAASNVAQVKLNTLIDRSSMDTFQEFATLNQELTEDLFRKRIADIPDGRYESVDFVEYDGQGVDELLEIRGALDIEGSDMRFSFEGSPQITAYINATNASVHANVMVHLLTTLGYGDLPFNAGMWSPLTIDVGEPGTVVNATEPAPVSTSHADGGARAGKVAKMMLNQALSLSDNPTLRGRVSGVASDGCPTAGLFGMDDAKKPAVLYYLDPGAGIGGPAQTIGDGQDSYGMAMMAGCGIPDVEVHESTDPVLFLWRKIATNTGGPGQLRGGQGMDQAYLIDKAEQMGGFFSTICAEVPPAGTGGGFAASASTQFPIRKTNTLELMADGSHPTPGNLEGTREAALNKDGSVVFRRFDVLQGIGGGGSGLGDPLLRAADLVVKDIRDGYITASHARTVYGVVYEDGDADVSATISARQQIREQRIGRAPELELREPDSVGISVTIARRADGSSAWSCGFCRTELSETSDDWRDSAILVESGINEEFAALEMYAVPRKEDPQVTVQHYYCAHCAGSLSTQVAPEGTHHRMPQLSQ